MAAHYAHSLPGRPESEWEPLEQHLTRVAELARAFARRFDAGDWGYLAGLWHDVGKYRPEFQLRLRGETVHAPHAGVGAALAHTKQPALGKLLAFVIAGHHTGLANLKDSSTSPTPLSETLTEFREIADQILEIASPTVLGAEIPALPQWFQDLYQRSDPEARIRHQAFFIRMLFSALVDADRLQTAEFYAKAEGREPDHKRLMYDTLKELRDRLDRYIDHKRDEAQRNAATPMNQLRAEVLDACRKAALGDPGIFSLTVPAGGGKTLSAMSFAIKHAIRREMDRVIVVIPYTSIIKQNAERYKEAFSPDGSSPDDTNVLEHHSAIDEQRRKEENAESELRRQTAAENWDAPVVVTTSVQFFESLFSNHPSRCRKLHRVAKSVIILDEVQTLPPALLLPILDGLKELTASYGCTVVLSTATPPALEQRSYLPDGLSGVKPIVHDPARLFESAAAQRVRVEWRVSKVTPYEGLAVELNSYEQVLAIVHRRQDARELCEMLPKEDRFHLSALMCPAHRIDRLQLIEQRLRDRKRCRLVSTQLVEAGVDIDFPVVYRALAGLDSLAQSAGRCDREGRRSLEAGEPAGRFVVFRAPTLPPPGTLRTAMEITDVLLQLARTEPELNGGLDPFNPRHGELYFRHLYAAKQLDQHQILTEVKQMNFANVNAKFQMIDKNGMRPIVVPYGEGLARAEAYAKNPTRETRRALQPFVVDVNRWYFDHLRSRGLVECLDGNDSVGLPTALFRDWYDEEEFGLNPDPEAPLAPDVLIQ